MEYWTLPIIVLLSAAYGTETQASTVIIVTLITNMSSVGKGL